MNIKLLFYTIVYLFIVDNFKVLLDVIDFGKILK